MPATYTPIATTTLTTSATSITFTGIPSTYTDIRAIYVGEPTSTENALLCELNSDTSTNYTRSVFNIKNNALEVVFSNNVAQLYLTYVDSGQTSGRKHAIIMDFMNYSNSNSWKHVITRMGQGRRTGGNANGTVEHTIQVWKSTSAITSMRFFYTNSYNISSGSQITLYGIKNA